MLEKQLEFDFYREMKKTENQSNFSRILWDRGKSVRENVSILAFGVGAFYLLIKGQEIKDYIFDLF